MDSSLGAFFYPIPKSDLLNRFQTSFSRLAKGQDSTLVTLPHTGRTSHLRFIISQKELLSELGITHPIKLIDSDTSSNLVGFLSEILTSLDSSSSSQSAIYSKDDYIVFNKLRDTVSTLSQKHPLSLVLTLKSESLSFLPQLDTLIVTLQKSALNYPLSILWSIDTSVYRQFAPTHPSSSIFESISFLPTFSKSETLHSLTRHFKLKELNIPQELKKNAQNITGGIAGLFHILVNAYPNYSPSTPQAEKIISETKVEFDHLPSLQTSLATPDCIAFLKNIKPSLVTFQSLLLNSQPTAQEISLLNYFLAHPNIPLSRDDIAEVLWGKLSSQMYSDWAIDKAISRLRSLIATQTVKVLTVKNLGYQLINL